MGFAGIIFPQYKHFFKSINHLQHKGLNAVTQNKDLGTLHPFVGVYDMREKETLLRMERAAPRQTALNYAGLN